MFYSDDVQNVRMRNMFRSSGPSNRSAYGQYLKPSFEEVQMIEAAIRAEQESRSGRQMREKFKYDEMANVNEHNRRVDSAPRLPQIAQSIVKPEVKPPMNVVFKDSISPYQQAQLSARDKDRESRELLAGKRIEQGDTKIEDAKAKTKGAENDRERRTKILEDKAKLGTMTDREKLEFSALTAANTTATTQAGMNTRQDDQQAFTEDRDKTTQESALARIAATLLGRDQSQINAGDITSRHIRERAAADDKPQSSTQEKTAIQLRMNQLLNEKPELRDHIKLIDGMPEIEEDSGFWGKKLTPAEIAEINKRLYGSGGNTPVKTAPVPEDTEKAPEGMKAGGKWITTRRGRVYMEPS